MLKKNIKFDTKNLNFNSDLRFKNDSNLSDVILNGYCSDGETSQELFIKVANAFSSNQSQFERIFYYLNNRIWMPSSPILINADNVKKIGLPISCFLSKMTDDLESINSIINECFWITVNNGGCGVDLSDIRPLGSTVNTTKGKSCGIVPIIKILEKVIRCFSESNIRRGGIAFYLNVHHDEIIDFINIRNPVGGDPNKKSFFSHHGVIVTKRFMDAVQNRSDYYTNSNTKLNALNVWKSILRTRHATGEPFIVFEDNIIDKSPEVFKKLNLANKCKMSNLCTEVILPTGKDYLNNNRTSICCLSSINLEHWDFIKDKDEFFLDIADFMDNVLNAFINNANPSHFKDAIYSAKIGRPIGIGVMGFGSLLQKMNLSFNDKSSYDLNIQIFETLRKKLENASITLAKQKGSCEDMKNANLIGRFTTLIAVAPTVTISNICDIVSPSIEPNMAMAYIQKGSFGSYMIKNKYLKKLLNKKNKDNYEVWNSILKYQGSVQHLDFLTEHEKSIYKTAYEINQNNLIEFAKDRAKYIDQSVSFNLFLNDTVKMSEIHNLHLKCYKCGLKTIYYCRSSAVKIAPKCSSCES